MGRINLGVLRTEYKSENIIIFFISSKLTVKKYTATTQNQNMPQYLKTVEELSKEYEGKDVKFYKVDVDDASEVSAKAGINCMPTFHFYKNGAKVDTMEGADEDGMKTKTAALV